jgi:site-specific DNA-methyltransferase (adenine-specific)
MILLQADARRLPFPDSHFKTIVTSPPYYGLRRYGDSDEEIGTETVDGYLRSMSECAKEWKRVISDDGVLWLNLADTASGSGGAGGDYNKGGAKEGKPKWRQNGTDRAPMQWLNIPHRVVEEFVAQGWLYRSCIIWDKERLRPEDLKHARRPGVSHEFIFMLSATKTYEFHADRLPAGERGSVWRFPPVRKTNHLAPFPDDIPERCITLTSNPGDNILDPFSGSHTTARIADRYARNGHGTDIYLWEQPPSANLT